MFTLIMCIARHLSFLAASLFFVKLWKEEAESRIRLAILIMISTGMGIGTYWYASEEFEHQVSKLVGRHILEMVEFGKKLEELDALPLAMPGDEVWKK